MLPTEQPFKVYSNLDGSPLNNGYVYFGEPDKNPITSPVTVYWDAAGTIPAAQPLRTQGGYIMRAGTPANVFFSGSYSQLVQDSKGKQVSIARNSDDFSLARIIPDFVESIGEDDGASRIGYRGRSVQSTLDDVISVKDARFAGGAKGDGVTDDTAAIMAAYTYFTTTFYGGALLFPPGNYLVSQLVWRDLYFKKIIFDGATLCGVSSSTSYDSVLKIINAENVVLDGLRFSASSSAFGAPSDVNKYAAGLSLQAASGGAIQPSGGILTCIHVKDLIGTNIRNTITVNAFDNDAQVAEITVTGMHTLFCPNPVRTGGSQAVVNFVGGSITSTPCPGLSNPEYINFLMEGGAVSMAGGEITNHGDAPGRVVDMRPASSASFFNPYGGFTAVGTLVETRWPFLRVNNPRGLASPLSTISHVTLSGCYGYSGELPASAGFMSVDDSSYAGKISVDEGCHFYQNAASTTRAAATINCSTAPQTLVSVGRKSFGVGYPHWISSVSGGRLIHGLELCIQAYVSGGTVAAGGGNVKPTSMNTSPRFARYSGMYDPSTGLITMPASGTIDVMRIEVNLIVGGAGDLYLKDVTNNVISSFGQIVGTTGFVGNLVATVANPAPGQQFSIVLNSGTATTFSGSTTNNISIFLSAT